jgi:hypothetical protein
MEAPVAEFDRFDRLALDLIAGTAGCTISEARELIAAELRVMHSEGRCAGGQEIMSTALQALSPLATRQ